MKTLISRLSPICKQLSTWKPPPLTHHHYQYQYQYRWYASPYRFDNEVHVWWDMDDCVVPTGVNVINTTRSSIDEFRANGILPNHRLLSIDGVNLVHNPNPDGTFFFV